jgi:predicted AAA+ superfamily ATPase
MNKIYERNIEKQIEKRLFEYKKIMIIYGPRQVGKTTLSKRILDKYGSEDGYFNCEELKVRDALNSEDSLAMHSFFGGHKVIVLDEAQTVQNIGRALKILIDAYPEMNIIATGSSSFDLANKISEPLTGRHYKFFLYPLSFHEIASGNNRIIYETLEQRLVFGSYPEIVSMDSDDIATEKLNLLASNYLYKDVLQFNNIKSSDILTGILRALAHQVGSDVSFNEIANLVGIDQKTVVSYINLLEQAFIIYRLSSLSRNMRSEIKKKKKFYFYDNGILNSLINNFNGEETGRDMGPLWENLMMVERLKYLQEKGETVHRYFWKTKLAEIDLIEEIGGAFRAYEFKYTSEKLNNSAKEFLENYNAQEIAIINKLDFFGFISS